MVTMLAGDAFRVELDAVDRQDSVAEPLDRGVLAGGIDGEAGGHGGRIERQRMIADGGERGGKALKQPAAIMLDRSGLAVNGRGTDNPSAEMGADPVEALHARDRSGGICQAEGHVLSVRRAVTLTLPTPLRGAGPFPLPLGEGGSGVAAEG